MKYKFKSILVLIACTAVVQCFAQLSTGYNYISSSVVTQPGVTTQTAVDALTIAGKNTQATYFDGLGRPLQQVSMQASPTGKDIVTPIEYDGYGREIKKFLPYMDGGTVYGGLKNTGYADQRNYYNNLTTGAQDNFPFAQTHVEFSPFNRPLQAGAAGQSWQPGNGHTVKSLNLLNTDLDEVRRWAVTNVSGAFGNYASTAYLANELFKTITIDEHGKQSIEFEDKEGKLVLKKVQIGTTTDNGSGSPHTGWLCTYYIYDNMNNLRCVIQPKGIELIQPTWVLTNATILAEQCFRYAYDERNQMIMKKVPGAGDVYIVYDHRDRPIMTQDALMRAAGKWMVTLYDDLNRPIQTGLLLNTYFGTTARTFAQHRSFARDIVNAPYPFDPVAPPAAPTWDLLTKTGYDGYDNLPLESGLAASINPTYKGSPYITGPFNSAPDYAQDIVMSNQTKGLVTWTQAKVLDYTPLTYLYTITIYDEKGRVIQVKSKNITGGEDIVITQYSWDGQPLVTVQKTEQAVAPAQTTVTVTKMTYDNLGRITKTEKRQSHTGINGGALSAYATISTMEYDALGQLKTKALGSKKDPATNTYYTPRQSLQELEHDYNIRGWMLGINKGYLATEGQTSDGKLFGFELGYDKLTNKTPESFNAAQWNGNINGMIWKSDGDDIRRKYDFTYDGANRLLKAEFEQQNPDDHAWNNSLVNYTVQMGDGSTATSAYDANGNIQAMTQYGFKLGANPQTPIDQLSYNYTASTNKLLNVIDAQNDAATKLGDFRTSTLHPTQAKIATTIDYTYDANGNMLKDLNKDLGKSNANGMVYNHLNLPRVVTVYKTGGTVKGTITYTYDAAGNKLSKIVLENGVSVPYNGTNYTSNVTTTTTYLGGLVYESKDYVLGTLAPLEYTYRLQFIGHEEGRIRYKPENSTLEYDYMIKDHLGNVRMVITEELKKDKYPVVSLETAKLTIEDDYYTIDQSKIVDANTVTGLPAYTNDNGIGNNPTDVPFETANSAKLYKLNSTTNKTGLGITLKVMSGDRIDIHGKSYYFQNNTGGTAANSAIPVLDILNGLLGGPSGSVVAGAHGGVTGTQLSGYPGATGGINTLLNDQTANSNAAPQVPKAYFNYIFFDEQFKSVAAGFSKVGTNSAVKNHFSELQNLIAPKNGYVYIYVSNESPVNVFFDNLQVVHSRGTLLEETHYYPFGLTMAGISSKALNDASVNRKKFNGIEHTIEFDLNAYDAFFRNADPQIGRWWEIDPKPNMKESPYSMMSNNPVFNIDPLGDTIINGEKVEPQTPEAATHLTNVTVTGTRIKAGIVNNPCTSCHIPYANVRDAQNQMFYEAMQNLDKAYGQVLPPRSPVIDLFLGHREIEAPDWWDDEVDNLINNDGILEVGADGYIIGSKPRVTTGMPPAVGLRGVPQIPSLTQRAANLSKQIGKNSITIKTVNGHIRYDLVGRAHGPILTPHSLRYTRNTSPSGMINFSKPKFPTPMTQQDLRIIRNYLKSLQ